jgi:GNAT superfamily N-acetyltransferase
MTVTPRGYTIASARSEDLAWLPAIELAAAQLLRGHAPESVLNEVTESQTFEAAARHGHLWVARAGATPVGFALVEMLAEDLPHLDEVDVAPAHGRRGLGTALVRAVCEWAASSGFLVVTLTTFRAVPWNLPFYARLGFLEIPPDQLRPELAAVVSDETARGLDPATRAVMAYRCDSFTTARPQNPTEEVNDDVE